MPEGANLAYRYSAFQIKIPKDIIGNVEKSEDQRRWLTFKLSDRRALRHNKADLREEEGIIRMARCRLPGIPQMIEKVRAYLMKFDEESWAYEHENEDKVASANADSTEGSATALGWECSAYLHYFWCMAPNVEDPWNNPDCVYRFSECVEWTFVEYPSPGGGGSGGNDPDPCAPCQPGMPCENESGGGGTPIGCQPEGGSPGLPTGPCDTSPQQLKDTFPDAPEGTLNELSSLINEHAADFGIDTEEEMQHFLAQAAHESSDWKGDPYSAFEENLNYRVNRLGKKDYWERYFNRAENPTADPNKANPFDYADYPGSTYVDHEKFANYVYNDANRAPGFKLGNTSPGDGYKYRGRGIIQLTGKDNYSRFNNFYQNHYNSTTDLVANPNLLANNTEVAVISALWFFKEHVLDNITIDENTSVETVTELINGSDKGMDHRKNLYNKSKNHINCL